MAVSFRVVFSLKVTSTWLSACRRCSTVAGCLVNEEHSVQDAALTDPASLHTAPGTHNQPSQLDLQTTHLPHNSHPTTATLTQNTNYCVNVEDQRFLKAAVIGAPNAGKSTLVNQLIGQKVFAVSPKRHTTLHKAMGIFTEGNSQVVLLDTPGLISYREGRKLKVSKQFLTDPSRSTMEADIIVVMVDAANKYTRGRLDAHIMKVLAANQHVPSVLVLNKVDLVGHKHMLLSVTEGLTGTMERLSKRKQIADLTRKLRDKKLPDKTRAKLDSIVQTLQSDLDSELSHTKANNDQNRYETGYHGNTGCHGNGAGDIPRVSDSWPHFEETFMVSSLTGDGVESLKGYLLGRAQKGEWQYRSCDLTDTPTLDLVEDIVREKLFKYLEKEIPYVLTQSNILWEHNEEGSLVIYQNINCRTDKQASIVIGPAGRTIQAITAEATEDIQQLLNCKVELTLNIRAHKK